jgi:hypothetical protein
VLISLISLVDFAVKKRYQEGWVFSEDNPGRLSHALVSSQRTGYKLARFSDEDAPRLVFQEIS